MEGVVQLDKTEAKVPANPDISLSSEERFKTYINGIAAKWYESGQRKQERSKRREQEIMRAAIRVFARDGISRARIGDIASEAGTPVSSLYDYFGSKEQLAYAVPAEHLARFYSEYAAAAVNKGTYRERLRLYLWLAGDFARRNPEWARLLYLEIWPSVLVSQTELRHVIDDYARVIIHLIREGAADGEWDGTAPYETAAILNGSFNHMITTWLLYRRPHNLMKAISSLIDRCFILLPEPAKDAAGDSRDADLKTPKRGRSRRTT